MVEQYILEFAEKFYNEYHLFENGNVNCMFLIEKPISACQLSFFLSLYKIDTKKIQIVRRSMHPLERYYYTLYYFFEYPRNKGNINQDFNILDDSIYSPSQYVKRNMGQIAYVLHNVIKKGRLML